jgi:2-oxoglutarate ferredoxin oxidoreductase subunit beta
MLDEVCKGLAELGIDKKQVVMVTGIGCSARASVYFKPDSVQGVHGRAIPLAEGFKRMRRDLKVLVFSGDGDLLGIGGNHLIHAARRDIDLTVLCNYNQIYGLTGGQMSPVTDKGAKTLTSPEGCLEYPLHSQGIITSNKRYFYGRSTIYHFRHFRKIFKEALFWEGFSYIDLISNCITNDGLRRGFRSAWEMISHYGDIYEIAPDGEVLKSHQLGVMKSNG